MDRSLITDFCLFIGLKHIYMSSPLSKNVFFLFFWFSFNLTDNKRHLDDKETKGENTNVLTSHPHLALHSLSNVFGKSGFCAVGSLGNNRKYCTRFLFFFKFSLQKIGENIVVDLALDSCHMSVGLKNRTTNSFKRPRSEKKINSAQINASAVTRPMKKWRRKKEM